MKQRNLKMEKNKLISFLNLIPDDVRCNIHGEYKDWLSDNNPSNFGY